MLFYNYGGYLFQRGGPVPYPAGKTQGKRAQKKPMVETETEFRYLLLLRPEIPPGKIDNGSPRTAGKGRTNHKRQRGALLQRMQFTEKIPAAH